MTISQSEEFHCCKCSLDLKGERHVKNDEGCFCLNCFNEFVATTCFSCQQKIQANQKSFANDDKYWHEDCFKCHKCRTGLADDKFGLDNKEVYCPTCFDESFAPTCFKCNELIHVGTKKLSWRDHEYHSECMKCVSCENNLSSEPFHPRSNGENYCLECFKEQIAYKCDKCSKAITDDGVLHEDKPYHADCFVCSECKASLKDKQFAILDSKEVCYNCYEVKFADKCASCDKAITSLDGDKHMEFEGRNWHQKCMACKKCKLSLVEKYFLAESKEDSSIDIMCLDCGLKEKGLDPEKYRDGFYDADDVSDEETSQPDPKLVDDFKLNLLEVHNKYRSRHSVPPLSWSNSCAKHAQEWAEKLKRDGTFVHSDNPRYGENIAKAMKLDPSPEEVVWHWYKEGELFDFSKMEFQPGTGHWAQVVWKSTKFAGFGYIKDGENTIIVGNYKCPGNMLGQFERNLTQPITNKENIS